MALASWPRHVQWLLVLPLVQGFKLFPSQCVNASGCNGTEASHPMGQKVWKMRYFTTRKSVGIAEHKMRYAPSVSLLLIEFDHVLTVFDPV